jgi:hypothetical protein
MEQEKKYIGGWWMWTLGLIVITIITLSALMWFGMIGRTIAERKVFENSFQYSQARKTEIATFEAQMSLIQGKLLNPNLDAETRTNLEAQISAIQILLKTAREKMK